MARLCGAKPGRIRMSTWLPCSIGQEFVPAWAKSAPGIEFADLLGFNVDLCNAELLEQEVDDNFMREAKIVF